MKVLGIDIGGTGIKHAFVETETGELLTERAKQRTPQPATPKDVSIVVNSILEQLDWSGPIGCGFPARIKNGVCTTAVNIDHQWIGRNLPKYFKKRTGRKFKFLNDADAAGLAEAKFGAGQNYNGRILMFTVGTGIGGALIENGNLLESFELGLMHYSLSGRVEDYISNKMRKAEGLSWEEWGGRVSEIMEYWDLIFSPDLYIIGGGVARKVEEYEQYIQCSVEWKPAKLMNAAGVIGAAIYASENV